MGDEGCDQQIAQEDMELAPARGGSWRQARRFDGDVKSKLQAHAAGQQPAVEIARVAQPVVINPDEPEQAAGNQREQNTLDRSAGEIFCQTWTASADRGVRRAPRRS